MGKKVMLIDTSKCISCRACQVACKMWHKLPPENNNEPRTDLTGTTLTIVREFEVEARGKIRRLFFKDQCRHCDSPACAGGCPLHAIIKHQPTGIVAINPNTCNPDRCYTYPYGKKTCERVCPYNIPRIDPARNKATKCDLCYDRVLDGSRRKTACADACPTGAIIVGDVDTVVRPYVYMRLPIVRARYPNAIIGGSPKGSSHVYWLLTEDPALYGLPYGPLR
jgi:formate dehydrogenase iron-sulfur subunit